MIRLVPDIPEHTSQASLPEKAEEIITHLRHGLRSRLIFGRGGGSAGKAPFRQPVWLRVPRWKDIFVQLGVAASKSELVSGFHCLRIGMNSIAVDQLVQPGGTEKGIGHRNGDAVELKFLLPFAAACRRHSGRYDRRMLIEFRMISCLLQHAQHLQILKKTLCDLLCHGIMGKLVKRKRLAPAGKRKISVEIRPIDLIADLYSCQRNAEGVQSVENGLVIGLGKRWVGVGQRHRASHVPVVVRGAQGSVRLEDGTNDQDQSDAFGLEVLRKIHVLVVGPQGGTHEANTGAFQLIDDRLLLCGVKILEAVDVDANRTRHLSCKARRPSQSQSQRQSQNKGHFRKDAISAAGVHGLVPWTVSRRKLMTLPMAANPAPSASATVAPSRPASTKQNAVSAAPIVCPVRRAVATMPLAPPLRPGGALDMIALKFGVWKKPKPSPQIAMRQTMLRMLGEVGSVASNVMPIPSRTRPTPPSSPTG